jgi:hypothetical protein
MATQPATAEIIPDSDTAAMGSAKLPVCCVILPTAHMATAPASEPDPLNSPIAVEMWAGETSCTIVRYIATQIPNPTFTAINTNTA